MPLSIWSRWLEDLAKGWRVPRLLGTMLGVVLVPHYAYIDSEMVAYFAERNYMLFWLRLISHLYSLLAFHPGLIDRVWLGYERVGYERVKEWVAYKDGIIITFDISRFILAKLWRSNSVALDARLGLYEKHLLISEYIYVDRWNNYSISFRVFPLLLL